MVEPELRAGMSPAPVKGGQAVEKPRETHDLPAAEPLDASAVSRSIARQLRLAHGQFTHRFLHYFAGVGLRPTEYCVLSLIAESPGRKQSEIAAALGIQRANFVSLMNDLEKRCLTERRSVPNDRRSYALYLTASGVGLLVEARRAEAEFEAECLERLGGARARDQFLTLLSRLFG